MSQHRILSAGNVSVDIKAFSYEDGTVEAYRDGIIDLVPGGVGRGMAINLKNLGIPSAICSVVGKDIFGDYLQHGLEEAGVDVTLLKKSSSTTTSLFSVMATAGQPASCIYTTRITREIVFDDAVRSFLDAGKADVLCFDSNLTEETLSDFYEYKKENGLFVFQNGTAPDIAHKSIPFAKDADLFACNEYEAAAMTGSEAFPDMSYARRFAELGYRHFIITFGEHGVMVYKDGEVWNEKPYKPAEIVDTIGAGDAFASGYLYGLLSGKPVKRCIQLGLACSKETLRTRQTVSSLLTADFIEQYPDHECRQD